MRLSDTWGFFNALRVHQNKQLMYRDLFIRRSPVHVVSGCLEVAPAVKARAWGKTFPFFNPHPHFEEGSISPPQFVFKSGPGSDTAELLGISSDRRIFFFPSELFFIFPLFRALSLLCYWLSIIRPVRKTNATFFFWSPKVNLGLRRSINNHLCAGDTCRSFYCGAEGNASCAAGLHGSPIRSIIKDTPATELIKKYVPQLLLAWPCLF